jgi:hypothetical protein
VSEPCRNGRLGFASGQQDPEDDERSERPPQKDICDDILGFLEKNPYSSSRDMSKALLTSKTTILRSLADLGLNVNHAGWIPHRLPEQQRADVIPRSRHMLQTKKDLGPNQENYLLMSDESWIC